MFYTTITMIIVTIVINSCIFVERERERERLVTCVFTCILHYLTHPI